MYVEPCKKCKRYKTPYVAVDGLIYDKGKILLIKRNIKDQAFYGSYALPGGFLEYNEKTEEAVVREVWEETGLKTEINQLIEIRSSKDRDPRGHILSISYSLRVKSGVLKKSKTPNEVSKMKWFDINHLPKLAFDHREIIHAFQKQSKIFRNYHGWNLNRKLVFCSHSRHLMHSSLLICKYVIEEGYVPINSFTNFGYFLYELVPRHDIAEGINNIINRCDEQWVFGPITEGVELEIEMCREIGKKVRYFDISEDESPCRIEETTESFLRKKYKANNKKRLYPSAKNRFV